MATYKAFTAHYVDLVAELSGSVDFIADHCIQELIISETTHKEVTESREIKHVKARTLLSAISSKIKAQVNSSQETQPDKCVFRKFVHILRREPSLEDIASKLEDKHSELTQKASRPDHLLKRRRSTIHEFSIAKTPSEGDLPMFTATVGTPLPSERGLGLRSPETITPMPATSNGGPDQRQIVTDNIDFPRRILKENEMMKMWESLRKMSALSAKDEAEIENYRQKCLGLEEKYEQSEYQKQQILERLEQKQRELEDLNQQRFLEGLSHKSELQDAEDKLQELTAEKEKLNEQYETCEKEIQSLLEKLESNDQEIEELKQSKAELDKALHELHKKYLFEKSFTGNVIAFFRIGLKCTCSLFLVVCVLIAIVAAYAQITQSDCGF